LPGLHDHHIHLFSLAASRCSIACGPPQIQDAQQLVARLTAAGAASGAWLRGVGYHESVAGDIDRAWLDAVLPDQPVRIQHRSGRLWILNSAALNSLGELEHAPLERIKGRLTGRLYDADTWLRSRLKSHRPPLADVCATLAGYGVTGLTDASVSNDAPTLQYLSDEVRRGSIPLQLTVMGGLALSGARACGGVAVGALKVHLHDHALPDLTSTACDVAAAHEAKRVVAFHCVTEAELAFALAALDEAGIVQGDRIEHAAMASPELVAAIAERALTVVTQPHFILERGDQYLRDVPAAQQSWLYRVGTWRDAGVAFAGGSDAPYGAANPWVAMQAAVERRTRDGASIGLTEALTPEQALGLYLTPPQAPGGPARRVAVGEPADLCLLDRPWAQARSRLAEVRVVATIRGGIMLRSSPAPRSTSC
jgi:predicted amidohydrolase YtcJ